MGRVIKAYGGYYYVYDGDKTYTCTLRGRVKAKGPVLAGDRVDMEPLPDGRGLIVDVVPRCSVLARPPVANIDQVVVVTSFHQPEPCAHLVNRLLLQAEAHHLASLVVVNKADLVAPEERRTPWMEALRLAGYVVLVISSLSGEGVPALALALAGHLSVLAGSSGVGKSSIIRLLLPEAREQIRAGEVSRKLGRGRHTTRHTELFHISGDGWVIDSPGFSRLSLPRMGREELATVFPEMRPYLGLCRFSGCLHDKEPGCAIKEAMQNGAISRLRYEEYLVFLRELMVNERRSPE